MDTDQLLARGVVYHARQNAEMTREELKPISGPRSFCLVFPLGNERLSLTVDGKPLALA